MVSKRSTSAVSNWSVIVVFRFLLWVNLHVCGLWFGVSGLGWGSAAWHVIRHVGLGPRARTGGHYKNKCDMLAMDPAPLAQWLERWAYEP